MLDRSGRRFQIVQALGRGGFGTVFRARMRSPGGLVFDVALKTLNRDIDPQSQPVERLIDEAKILTRISHPSIASAHDLAWFGSRPSLVSEYIEGVDLEEALMDRDYPLPTTALLDVMSQVASALAAAWKSGGVVHRDVKPANIRIARQGIAKLLDFGIARSELFDREADTTLGMVGSFLYLAPERLDVKSTLDPSSDVFSLGCVLYEGLTKRPLFHKVDMPTMLRMSRSAELFSAFMGSKISSEPLESSIRALLIEMLAFEPRKRPGADQVAERCEQIASSIGVNTMRGTSGTLALVSLRAWCRERPWPEPGEEPKPEEPEKQAQIATEIITKPKGEEPPRVVAPQPPTLPILPSPARGPVQAKARARWPWLGAAVIVGGGAVLASGVVLLALIIALGSEDGPGVPQLQLQPPDPLEMPEPTPVPQVAPVVSPVPSSPGPQEEPQEGPSATEARVLFVGSVGATVYLDDVPLGPTNLSYPVLSGAHRCGIGHGRIERSESCEIAAETRSLNLPDPPIPASVAAEAGSPPIVLRDYGGNQIAIGLVPAGSYEILADFGQGMVLAGKMLVRPGAGASVRCDGAVGVCIAREAK